MSRATNNIIYIQFVYFQESHEDDWYNKSLTALRMNNAHHSLTNPVLQYQAWLENCGISKNNHLDNFTEKEF